MQNELGRENFVILGINEAGHESDNETICDGRDVPWLQDTAADNVWDTWTHVYRDVIILDRAGQQADVYNLTDQDLGEQANYDALKALMQAAIDG